MTLCITYVRITYNLDKDTFIMFEIEEICERNETSPPAGQNVQRDTRLPAGGKRPAGGLLFYTEREECSRGHMSRLAGCE